MADASGRSLWGGGRGDGAPEHARRASRRVTGRCGPGGLRSPLPEGSCSSGGRAQAGGGSGEGWGHGEGAVEDVLFVLSGGDVDGSGAGRVGGCLVGWVCLDGA